MILTGENISIGEKPVPVPFCAPKIPRGLTWDRIWVSAVTGSRITASTMARPPQSSHVMRTFIVKKYLFMCMCIHIHIYIFFILYKNIQPVAYSSLVYTYVYRDTQPSQFVDLCFSCHLNLVTYSVLE
jgi:hypothetical protein